jgi:hypothetical protein
MKSVCTVMTIVGLFVAAISQIGCKGEQGPQGPSGDSVLALEGFAPNIKCGTCHNPDEDTTYHVLARVYQWQQSKHANGGDIERNGSACAGCHTTEAFIQRTKGLTVTDQPNPSPPGCFACHSPHSRGDFSLRVATPVTLLSNINGVADYSFDYGKGNLCAACHQPRAMTPKLPANPASTDTFVITNSRWEPHHGPQSAILSGFGGYKFPGYTYRGNSNHAENTVIRQEGCPICHMASQVYPPNQGTGKAGGHTMNIHYEAEGTGEVPLLTGCKTSGCHPASFSATDMHNAQRAVEDSLALLETMLIQRGWLNPTTHLVNASASSPLRITPAVKAGALFNYFYVESDQSLGIHNTKHVQDLLNSSLQVLRQP